MKPPKLKDDCFSLPPGVDWTPVDDALVRLRERLRCVVGEEEIAVARAGGRVLSKSVHAGRSNPAVPNSAVDGYGFAFAALTTGVQNLPLVVGRAAAGQPFAGQVPGGSAVRILTGAQVPGGVDTVILQEDVTENKGAIAFHSGLKQGANTRKAGEDVKAGDKLFGDGHRLRPTDLALISATGVSHVPVRKALRVGVLSTGDELRSAGEAADDAQVFDANRPMLLEILKRWDHEAVDLGHVSDDLDKLRDRFNSAVKDVDAIITSGGASAGDEDHVSALLRNEGFIQNWRIALKPGRPLALGQWQNVPVFGLPGNPVAAFVCTLLFARPALAVLSGAVWPTADGFQVPAAFEKSKKPGRREYLRARVSGDGQIEVFASEGSGRISGLSWADGLVELGDHAQEIRTGDLVKYLPYGSFGL